MPRLTQPSTVRGMVKSAFGLSNNKWRWWMWVIAATGRLAAQVGWPGLPGADLHLTDEAVNSRNDLCHDGSTINIVPRIIIIIIIIIINAIIILLFYYRFLHDVRSISVNFFILVGCTGTQLCTSRCHGNHARCHGRRQGSM